MAITNYEFKARTERLEEQEQEIRALDPKYIGEDHQKDTYFNIPSGRLKLREGNIENSLIYYERQDTAGAKQSDVLLFRHPPDRSLKEILTRVHGIKIVVDKKRRIYFIENVKFHFDRVEQLGSFIEVEAIDESGTISVEELKKQCDHYAEFLEVAPSDYVAESYSDLVKKGDAFTSP